jgi:single-stranded-DNA-specific exonuclease
MAEAPKIWKVAESAPGAEALAERTGLPLQVAGLLLRRGVADVDAFLEPRLDQLSDPLLLPDMPAAVERIWAAIDAKQRILVFGDYDVDGITSTCFLSRVLERLGATVDRFIPNRQDDGYGLSMQAIGQCLERFNPDLIITVDCGTGNTDAVSFASEKGVDVVVTDHHEASGGEVAPALAVVNPKLGSEPDLQMLAGVGVAFKLCHALLKVGRQQDRPSSHTTDMRPLMYLVALGTVADMVPLVGENRILAKYGLQVLNQRPDPGIDALVRTSGIQQEMTGYHIGFVLGPRLNAAGRMASPDLALELLLSGSPRHAMRVAQQLEESNKERQAIEETIRNQAMSLLEEDYDPDEPGVLVVASRAWHKGVVGIVASRLVRRFHRPAIVISIDDQGMGRGSCRSIPGYDLIQNLESVSELLTQYGGHRMAAGLDIEEGQIDELRRRLNDGAREVMGVEDLRPSQHLDGWIGMEDLSEAFLRAQDRLMPFGNTNPVPVWGLRNVSISYTQRVGYDKKHLRLLFDTPHGQQDAIGFGFGDQKLPDGPVDLAFQLRRNVFRGEESLQLLLQDLRPSE